MARRRRRSFRRGVSRVRHRFRRGHRVKTSMMTKVVNTLALAIGLEPVIASAQAYLPSGNFQAFGQNVLAKYSAGFSENGQFSTSRAIEAYGPIVGAIVFKKAFSMLKRHIGKTVLG